MSSSSETLEVNENIQANGRYGVVQTERNANITVNADLYAVYTKGGGLGAAMAVSASGNSTVTLNGGDYRQVGVPENDPCDLIYGDGSAQIFIKGGYLQGGSARAHSQLQGRLKRQDHRKRRFFL